MDRPEPGLVRWSPNPERDSFIHINLQRRIVQLYHPTGHARRGRFDHEKVSKFEDFPPLTTYDWSPVVPGLVAVGTCTGVVNLLRIDDDSNGYLELGLKMARNCQAVAFSTAGMLAVGLDRVRMDQSLHIWDVNRLSSLSRQSPGFPHNIALSTESTVRLEPSVSVSSIKFFEDNPQTLVVGIKGQGLRIHDLRDPGTTINFLTKCNNNLAIDYADQNYFASSTLDQPGVMIWDRRATSRPVSAPDYLQAIEEDDLPWGSAIRLDSAIVSNQEQSLAEKHSVIRSLRFCRDQRGLLGILSRSGQLKVIKTNKENSAPDPDFEGSPELLQVSKSYEMDVTYGSNSKRNSRIVSFDWVTLGNPVLSPRLLVLRENGSFDILEQPSCTSDHLYKLVPWQPPHRGLEEGFEQYSIMQFDPPQAQEILGPLFIEQTLSGVPIFASERPDLDTIIEEAVQHNVPADEILENVEELKKPLPESFYEATTISEKLAALRSYVKDIRLETKPTKPSQKNDQDGLTRRVTEMSISAKACRESHEDHLMMLLEAKGLPSEAQMVLDHVMLLRAKERYLFDADLNREVVSDDPWLRYVWDWIADAEDAAVDGGMIQNNVDLAYLGVYTIWTNYLGTTPSTRLQGTSNAPDEAQWERFLGALCKKHKVPKYNGVETKRPHHRQLCLYICGWGVPDDDSDAAELGPEFPTTAHTMATARALFRGNSSEAVQILKRASVSHPELLFVSLALQLMGRGNSEGGQRVQDEIDPLDFDEAVASRTDPYLRAISSLIATGDWAAIANQESLPLSDRVSVAVRYFSDDQLTTWLSKQVVDTVNHGDIEAIVLTGVTEQLVDILARYVEKFYDFQTATLITSLCSPRYFDDYRCAAWRTAYRAYLQRHRAFLARTKFEVESTQHSKRDSQSPPLITPASRQIALRCVYCDALTTLARYTAGGGSKGNAKNGSGIQAAAAALPDNQPNLLTAAGVTAGIACPSCGRHLPRCAVCLEVVGVPRSDRPEVSPDPSVRAAARFPTFCLRCEHVMHLDHARQWFARHSECAVPECRCRCNFRANPELNYH